MSLRIYVYSCLNRYASVFTLPHELFVRNKTLFYESCQEEISGFTLYLSSLSSSFIFSHSPSSLSSSVSLLLCLSLCFSCDVLHIFEQSLMSIAGWGKKWPSRNYWQISYWLPSWRGLCVYCPPRERQPDSQASQSFNWLQRPLHPWGGRHCTQRSLRVFVLSQEAADVFKSAFLHFL